MTSAQFNELILSGKLRPKKGARYRFGGNTATFGQLMEQIGSEGQKTLKKAKKPKKQRKEAPQLTEMKLWLTTFGIKHTSEYKFSTDRKFRFDICIEEKKIAIEYEGIMSRKSGHTTVKGYTKDTEKYNQATSLGYRFYRYTVLNYKDLLTDLKTF